METSSVIVVASASEAEQLLLAGDIGCPGCNATLRPHGTPSRTVRGVGAQRVTRTPADPEGAVHHTDPTGTGAGRKRREVHALADTLREVADQLRPPTDPAPPG